MNSKQVKVVFVLVIIVGLLAWGFDYWKSSNLKVEGSRLGEKFYQDLPLNEVNQVVIHYPAKDPVRLVSQDGVWKVTNLYDHPVDFQRLRGLILKFNELKILQKVPADPSQLASLGVVDPKEGSGGTKVTLKKGEEVVASIILGESKGSGRYLVAEEKPEEVWVVKEGFLDLSIEASDWLDKTFVKPNRIQSVECNNPKGKWKIARDREEDDFKMVSGKRKSAMPQYRGAQIDNQIRQFNISTVADPKLDNKATGLNKPLLFRVRTFEGFYYEIRLGKSDGQGKRYASVKVEAYFSALPKPIPSKKPGPEQSEEEWKKEIAEQEKAFQENLKRLEAQLSREKKLESWVYLIDESPINLLLKPRSELMKK